jgi:predicted oxidoreductase
MKNKLSRIIQGCMNWGQWGSKLTVNEMESLIHHNLDIGISSFDHADIWRLYNRKRVWKSFF